MKKYLFVFLAMFLMASYQANATNYSGQLGDAWMVESEADGGSIIPDATGQDIGSSSYPVDVFYVNTVTKSTRDIGTVNLPIFAGSASGVNITTSTAPGMELDNLLPSLVWSDGETTPVNITFRVPDDYISGGVFRLMADSSSSTTPVKVDFSVRVNTSGSAWDAAVTDQTPVALAQVAGTPELVTLTPATDFASLAAGKFVTLNLWRDDVADGTGDLEVYMAEFYYNRK